MLAGKRNTESSGEIKYRMGDERLVKLTASAADKDSAVFAEDVLLYLWWYLPHVITSPTWEGDWPDVVAAVRA